MDVNQKFANRVLENIETGDTRDKVLCLGFDFPYHNHAPCSLQSARNGGSLTSSIGANSKGKEPNSMFPIFTIIRLFMDSVCRECLQCLHQ